MGSWSNDALKKLQNVSTADVPVTHFDANDTHNDSGSDVARTEPTSGKFMGYDPDAMKAVLESNHPDYSGYYI